MTPGFLESLEASLDAFSPAEQALARAAFRHLLAGRAETPDTLAAAAGLDPGVARAAVAHLVERGTVMLDATGAVLGARGLSLAATPHTLTVDGRRLYTFCAVDAIGIPIGLGLDAEITSRCPACHAPLALVVRGGAVTPSPSSIVVWAADRDPARSLREHT